MEDVVTTIITDDMLRRFDRLVQREPDSIVHATIRGRFFAGDKRDLPGGTFWTGYGHFGLFSLLVIERIIAVDAHDLRNVDYRAYPDSPPIDRVGCFTNHLGGIDYSEAIAQQQAADAGSLPWILADPMRVATEHALRQLSSASHAYALSDEAPVE